MRKKVVVLGSTGSIGVNTLTVLEKLRDSFEVVGIAGNSNVDKLLEQTKSFKPAFVGISSEESAEKYCSQIENNLKPKIYSVSDALVDVVLETQADIYVCSTSVSAGFLANMLAFEKGTRIALANKETLVCAGALFLSKAHEHGTEVIPVDSEHSAVFQALHTGKRREIRKIILTASGGPFRNHTPEMLETVTVSDALGHPTWDMGRKITIDSSTMFNKALEIIEAKWLFGVGAEKLSVVVHPQSLIHSMVEWQDGNVIAQMSKPDMKVPIQYALTFPDRLVNETVARFDALDFANMTFEPADFERFPALKLGFEVLSTDDTTGAIFNAANEVAVEAFLSRDIKYTEIYQVVKSTMLTVKPEPADTLEKIIVASEKARKYACRACQS
ncbi:MAG: 1-deoxy-D-xylulose-5-phosphate reductoisomerase [Planctomycetes bacterium]|nr:1-deoxy-D-xylulose-5-phosphate reductoisomerase [Planctomycetota bacterium]